MSMPLYLAGDDFGHFRHALVVGMNAVGLHLVAVVGKERVEVDDVQTIFLGHLLQDGNDVVGDDSVVDVPC